MLIEASLLHAEVTIGWHIESDDEGNIFIVRRRRHIGAGIEVRRAIVSTGGETPAEELHALRYDFSAVTLAAAVARFVFAIGDAAFDVSLAAFPKITPASLSRLASDHDIVPLRLFAGLAVAAGEAFGGAQREVAHALT